MSTVHPAQVSFTPAGGTPKSLADELDTLATFTRAGTGTVARTISAKLSDVVNVRDFGAVCDGVTDDTTKIQAMQTALGATPTTIVVNGPIYVSANFFFPAIQPIRVEAGGFTGPGLVTFTSGAPIPRNGRRLTGTQVIDYSYGTYVMRNSATGASITQDKVRGAQAMTWTSATANQFVEVVVDGTWDLSAAASFTIDLGFAEGDVNTYITAFFSSDATYTTFANFAQANVGGSNNLLNGFAHLPRTSVTFTKAAMNQTGTPNFAAIKHIGIRLNRNGTTNAVPTAYLYGLWRDVTARPKVLLTFDDGPNTLYTKIFPIMKAANLRGTAYLNGNNVDTVGYSTTPQLREMYAAGWDLGNHGWDHAIPGFSKQIVTGNYTRSGTVATIVFGFAHGYSVNDVITIAGADQPEYNGTFTIATVPNSTTITFPVAGVEPRLSASGYAYIALDPGIVRSQIRRNREWLLQQGWPRAAQHVAYPYGSWDLSVLPILQEFGTLTGRVVGASNTNLYNISTFNGLGAPFMLPGYSGDLTGTAAGVLAEVDNAIAANGTFIFFTHGLADSSPSSTQMLTSEFQGLVNGLVTRQNAGQIDVVTISNWYNNIADPLMPLPVSQPAVLFAALGSPPNGTTVFCLDAVSPSNPATGGGTGALCVRQNGIWKAL